MVLVNFLTKQNDFLTRHLEAMQNTHKEITAEVKAFKALLEYITLKVNELSDIADKQQRYFR